MACAVAAQVQDGNQVILRSCTLSCHEAKTWSSLALDVGDKFLELPVVGVLLIHTPINIVLLVLINVQEASATELAKTDGLVILLIAIWCHRAWLWRGIILDDVVIITAPRIL